ncbi:hypothetical protein VOLCADRAFT_89719 [Volvox carteri f. nagariensis]|uniref:Histone chaperone RTT106/FACT complex subunit SPT16-like middle domain-containing protein n=1 Tax=Volvox carteri f. nagariensis TaxID=3068 RepID=D8TSG5_VOLCA|nr:uncharacterized protein VOLCADRAFT_89719 [Volvox carteri f. nagariensis]EFJ49366.1 hypothetical protein VOLCADRAFT_89719 [Volvox carteri f. nagariensis]|eukprot:XP_002949347.1 hypothetical protein VOLCADRAFT_89719 [Volvox carteri f. nagariensis]
MSFSRETFCLANAKGNIVVPTKLLTHVAILDQIPQDAKKRCLLFLVLDKSGSAVMNGKQRLEVIIVQTLESDSLTATASSGEVLEGPVAAVVCQAVGMCIPNFANFLAPEPEVYKSARGHVAVPAVVKVNSGLLFPLPGAVLFAERPAIFIPHSDILGVEYRRPQSATFDLVVHTKSGTAGGAGEASASGPAGAAASGGGGVAVPASAPQQQQQQVEFSQIDRGELGRLQSYFATSKIRVRGGKRPSKRPRSELSGAVAGSSLPGGSSGAGPSGSRQVEMEDMEGTEDGDDDEDEDDEGEDSYDDEEDEDELADLTDEEDLRADDVRQRVGRSGGAVAAAAAGKGAPSRSLKSRMEAEEEEEEEEEEEDYEDDDAE